MREFVSFRVASTDNAQFTILIISYHSRQRSDCNLDRYGYLVLGLLVRKCGHTVAERHRII